MASWLPPDRRMDIARPEFKVQKRRRQMLIGAAVVLGVAAISIGVSRLKPAAPSVERGTVWTDTVKRGSMLRQVRGLGSLVPSQDAVRQIPAETEATVVSIRMLPGSEVKADTILLEMSNPQTEQAAVDAQLQLKAAVAEYQSLRVRLESELMNQKAGAATVSADHAQAQPSDSFRFFADAESIATLSQAHAQQDIPYRVAFAESGNDGVAEDRGQECFVPLHGCFGQVREVPSDSVQKVLHVSRTVLPQR